MPIEAAQLVARFRSDVGDPELPGTGSTTDEDSLWSNSDILSYIDQAQFEFARRTKCFPDFTNYTASVVSGEPWVPVKSIICDIRFGVLNTAGTKVIPKTLSEVEEMTSVASIMTDTGTPQYLITDMEPRLGRLFPIPTADDDITLAVYRYPETHVTSVESKLEVEDNDELRLGLLHKVKALAYSKYDADAGDKDKAFLYERKWEDFIRMMEGFFSKKRRTPRSVRYGGI